MLKMNIKETKTITIPLKEYNELLEDSAKFNALEAYGVDNWCGYGDAMQSLLEDEEDDE